MNEKEIEIINKTIESFIANPENFMLFRGETMTSGGGLHFSMDESWAKNFGNSVIKGSLPIGSKVKSLTEDDFKEALSMGILSEQALWDLMFIKGYDAILGTDSMNKSKLDVIVNPKHLERFK